MTYNFSRFHLRKVFMKEEVKAGVTVLQAIF